MLIDVRILIGNSFIPFCDE